MKPPRMAQRAPDGGASGLPGLAAAPTGFPGAPYGLVSFAVADTNPGARCVLAPAEGHRPSAEAYREGLRYLWRTDPGSRQHMAIFARYLDEEGYRDATEVVGPYAAEAAAVLRAIRNRR